MFKLYILGIVYNSCNIYENIFFLVWVLFVYVYVWFFLKNYEYFIWINWVYNYLLGFFGI